MLYDGSTVAFSVTYVLPTQCPREAAGCTACQAQGGESEVQTELALRDLQGNEHEAACGDCSAFKTCTEASIAQELLKSTQKGACLCTTCAG